MQRSHNTLKGKRFRYWNGQMQTKEELEENGWEPQPLLIPKGFMETYMDGDEVLLESEALLDIQKEKVSYLEKATKEIANRNYLFNNIVAWKKFINPVP